MNQFGPLICITTDASALAHHEQVDILISRGARFIQIRTKLLDQRETLLQVEKAHHYAEQSGVVLIINDFVEIARMTAISGVHLGSSDCSALDARKLLGEDAIIGSTIHNLNDAIQVSEEGVSNYVGLGPYRKSKTKHDLDPILSEKIILEIMKILSGIPVFMIGGIELRDCELVSHFDLAGIALCSALSGEGEYASFVPDFISQLNSVERVVA